jgi:hypothetical protein
LAGIEAVDQLAAVRRQLAELALRAVRAERDELVRQLRLAIANRDIVPAATELLDRLIEEDGDGVAAALHSLDE